MIPVYVPGTRVSRAALLLAAFVACSDGICQSDNGEATVPENVIVRGTIVSKVDASDTILRSTLNAGEIAELNPHFDHLAPSSRP